MAAAVSNGFKLAWKKDREDTRDKKAHLTLLASPPTPAPTVADNSALVKIVDQGQLGSCTANASGQAIRCAELVERVEADRAAWLAAGNPVATFDAVASLAKWQTAIEFWSRLMSYYLARSYDHDTANDDGTEIRLIFQAINKYGFSPESIWPYNDNTDPKQGPVTFNKMPPSAAFRAAFDARSDVANVNADMIDYARITSSGTSRVNDIMTALGQQHVVVFGTLVTEQFCSDMSANNGKPIARPNSATTGIAGGHALCIDGGDQNGADVPNSWGLQFGGRGGLKPGHCKFGWDYIMWDETTDLWIVKRAPFLAVAA